LLVHRTYGVTIVDCHRDYNLEQEAHFIKLNHVQQVQILCEPPIFWWMPLVQYALQIAMILMCLNECMFLSINVDFPNLLELLKLLK